MIRLMLADDEPLVLVGLQSILNWNELGIEIIGTARNGKQAMEMIEQEKPDIVITDIKMPLKSGLEVCKECAEKYGRVPVFIILTNYEEFSYVREALKYQAVEYLVKLELEPESLMQALNRAMEVLKQNRTLPAADSSIARDSIGALREKFFVRLFNNLFETEEMYRLQMQELMLHLDYPAFNVASCEILPLGQLGQGDIAPLFANTVQTVRETLARFLPCYVVSLDLLHFSVVLCFPEEELDNWRGLVTDAFNACTSALRNYLNVSLHTAIGHLVRSIELMGVSYQASQRCCHGMTDSAPLVFCPAYDPEDSVDFSQSLHQLRNGIRQAFEELDMRQLEHSLSAVIELYLTHPDLLLEVMDSACNILYMAVSLLPDGEETLQQIFQQEPDGYRGLYQLRDVESIAAWVGTLRDGCVELLKSRRQNYKEQVVQSVKAYIRNNLDKRLSLQEVAAVFNFSPNYLSQLFAKYSEEGFVEYITSERIHAAKELLKAGDAKIYEIADKLGFESSFYFSKVFKKVTGVSPREYSQRFLEEQRVQ